MYVINHEYFYNYKNCKLYLNNIICIDYIITNI